jgi:DNA-directed RNA polymerase specialized sigma subunit
METISAMKQSVGNPVGLSIGNQQANITRTAAANCVAPFAGKDSIELGRAIDRLPELERLVLSLHYYEELNFTEIGMVLNLKQSKISRIHNHAMYRLKAGFTRS